MDIHGGALKVLYSKELNADFLTGQRTVERATKINGQLVDVTATLLNTYYKMMWAADEVAMRVKKRS